MTHLLTFDLATLIMHERLADAEAWRRFRYPRRDRSPNESSDRSEERSLTIATVDADEPDDLGGWLRATAAVLEGHTPHELGEERRRALASLVATLEAATGETRPGGDLRNAPAPVLYRALGRLSERTIGRSVPLSIRRSREVEAALEEVLNPQPALAGMPSAEPTQAA